MSALRLVMVLLAVASGLGLGIPSARGGCIGPGLEWKGALRPGFTIVIHGTNFRVGCNDNKGVPASGCGPTREPVVYPMDNIRVTLTQDGQTHVLGVRDANQNYEFRLETELPAELHPGPATLRADGGAGDTPRGEARSGTTKPSTVVPVEIELAIDSSAERGPRIIDWAGSSRSAARRAPLRHDLT